MVQGEKGLKISTHADETPSGRQADPAVGAVVITFLAVL